MGDPLEIPLGARTNRAGLGSDLIAPESAFSVVVRGYKKRSTGANRFALPTSGSSATGSQGNNAERGNEVNTNSLTSILPIRIIDGKADFGAAMSSCALMSAQSP